MSRQVEMTKDGAIIILVDEASIPKYQEEGYKKVVAPVKKVTTNKQSG